MIPQNIRKPGPYTEIDSSGANKALPAYAQEMIIVAPKISTPVTHAVTTAYTVGQCVKPATANGQWYVCVIAGTSAGTAPIWPTTAAATVTDGTVTWRQFQASTSMVAENTAQRVYSPDEAGMKFGVGSIAHRMAIAAFRQHAYVMLTVIGQDDAGSGVAATGSVVFSGTATEKGYADLYIGKDKISISWDSGATAAQIAAKVVAEAIRYPQIPVHVTALSATVTLTAKCKGTTGNFIGKWSVANSKHEAVVNITGAGVSAAITGMASGALDSSMTTALAAVAAKPFDIYAIPYQDATAISDLAIHLGTIADIVNQRGGRGFTFTAKAFSDATTMAAANYERVHVGWVRKVRLPSYEACAGFAALIAASPHPALPLNDAELAGCDAPEVIDRLSFTEVNDCLWAGVTPFEVGSGDKVRCVRAITSYTKNNAGSADPQWVDTTVVANIDYLRKSINSRHKSDLAGKALKSDHADGDPDFIVTPSDVRLINIDVCLRLERYGCLQNVKALADRFVSVLDPTVKGRVNSDIPAESVQGAHIFANSIRIVS